MLTYVTADINCPTCFNQVIETITATPGVHTVAPHADTGCLVISHDLDDSALLATITTVGHTLDIAPNGEITMGQAHATTVRACDAHEPRHQSEAPSSHCAHDLAADNELTRCATVSDRFQVL